MWLAPNPGGCRKLNRGEHSRSYVPGTRDKQVRIHEKKCWKTRANIGKNGFSTTISAAAGVAVAAGDAATAGAAAAAAAAVGAIVAAGAIAAAAAFFYSHSLPLRE